MSDAAGVDRAPIRAHFIEKIGGDPDLLPDDDADLVDEGILDSFGLSELVAVIESTYDIKIPDADVKLESFTSVSMIADYVASRS
jgi:acyl carrier protein